MFRRRSMIATPVVLYVAPFSETRWIVASSFLFLGPCYYGYTKRLYSHSALLLIVSAVSANYWRCATYSWRRNIDFVVARSVSIVFASSGALCRKTMPLTVAMYSVCAITYSCYHLSSRSHKANKPYWWIYHVLFHTVLTCQQQIVLYCLANARDN